MLLGLKLQKQNLLQIFLIQENKKFKILKITQGTAQGSI